MIKTSSTYQIIMKIDASSKRSMNIDKNQNRISDNISNFMEHSLISEEMGTLNSSVENSPRKDGNGNGRGVN